MVATKDLQTSYRNASAVSYEMDASWEDWFNPDISPEVSFPWHVEDIVLTQDVVVEMLDQGETYWSHPGWIKDLFWVLDYWALEGQLIRIRLNAEWLLTTLPPNIVDEAIALKLHLLAEGQFCAAFEGMHNAFPAFPDHYLTKLNLNAAAIAQQHLEEIGISGYSQ